MESFTNVDINYSWLAGALDGEGTLCLLKKKREKTKVGYTYEARIGIANTDINFINKSKDILGDNYSYLQSIVDKRYPDSPICHRLYWTPNTIRNVLPKLLPYLIKRKQAELVLEATTLLKMGKRHTPEKLNRLEEIYWELKRLHKPNKYK